MMKIKPEKIKQPGKAGKEGKIPFSAKKTAKNGLIACALDGGSLALFIGAVVLSFYEQGQGGRLVGVLGILSFIAAIAGCVYGFLGYREEDRKYGTCTIGAVGGGLIVIFELFLCLSGI